MACLELTCKGCGYWRFSNSYKETCPKCGCLDSHALFDEIPESDSEEESEE